MHVFVFYFLSIAFSILVYMLFSYSAFRLQEYSIKSVSLLTSTEKTTVKYCFVHHRQRTAYKQIVLRQKTSDNYFDLILSWRPMTLAWAVVI